MPYRALFESRFFLMSCVSNVPQFCCHFDMVSEHFHALWRLWPLSLVSVFEGTLWRALGALGSKEIFLLDLFYFIEALLL